jgi:beta-glucosidase-like glycosyl hydrolase
VLDGRISEERLNASVRRILKLKLDYGLDNTLHENANINAMNAKFRDLLSK